jgi:phosphotriesterase-related protein
MSMIRTVRGDIEPSQLGVTLLHEHILTMPPQSVADCDLELSNEAVMTMEVAHFKAAGGGAIVEMSPRDYGRNPEGIRRISTVTGVHVIAITGWIKQAGYTTWSSGRTVNAIADEMIADVMRGMDGGDIRAGVIKAGSSKNQITDEEEKVIRAAAIAHRETGAPISTHTEAGTMGIEQANLFIESGVSPERILIGHCDRNLDWDYHLALANKGVLLGFDQIGKDKYYPDTERVAFINRLIEHGFADQIALSGDLARQTYFPGYGGWQGPGYTYVLWRFAPMLREAGIAVEVIDRMLIETPRRFLAIA